MAISLAYRYTSSVANASQLTPENSVGGYISTNNIYTTSTITSRVSPTATSIDVASLPTATTGLANVGEEIVEYGGIDSTNSKLLTVGRGKVPNSSPLGFPHGITPNEGVGYLTVANLFDPKFDNLYTQYRCIVVKNMTDYNVENVSPILIQDSTSDVEISIGIEVPAHDYHTGALTSVTSSVMIVNTNYIGSFSDNFFANSLLRITSGAASGNSAVIGSYDDGTGTFVLESTIGSPVAGDLFEIEPPPSQIVINQLTAPVDNGRFFGFISDGGSDEISHGGVRERGNVFSKNDIFYLWVRRQLTKNVKSKSNTGSVILISYLDTGS